MRDLFLGVLSLALLLTVVPGCDEGDDDDVVGDDDATAGDDDAMDDDAADDDDDATAGDDDDDAAGEVVTLLVSSLGDDVQYFTYAAGQSVTVEYFGVMGGDGAPHVAFDACDVCFPAGLGYSQAGDRMVCNNCGNSYPINAIGTENQGGGCWPGYIEMDVVGDEIQIQASTLEAGSYYFQ